jgi:signal peptidase I
MTNLESTPGNTGAVVLPKVEAKTPSRRGRAVLAALLSFFFTGLGQLYNRQPWKALAFAIVNGLFPLLLAKSHIPFHFWGLLGIGVVSLVWKAFVVGEAAYVAATANKAEPQVRASWLTYSIVGIIVVGAAIFPATGMFRGGMGFRAFKISSDSMCPTMCRGDRIVADFKAYKTAEPRRGDLIVFRQASGEIYVKRVAGVGGDVVAPGPNGAILVNGEPFRAPAPCGAPVQQNPDPSGEDTIEVVNQFVSTKVPENSFFVVGDNLNNSFDSRYPQFGAVRLSDIRGKGAFIYWSGERSRIGCRIR